MAAVNKALAHLRKVSPEMKALIKRVGPCGLEVEARTPFQALVSAVAHQQLHGKAAATILGRLYAQTGGGPPHPEHFDALQDEHFRAAGFSGSKTAALRDLASKTVSGVVPSLEEISTLSDEEIRWKNDNAALYRQLAVRSARSMRQVDALEEVEPGRPRIEVPGAIPLSELKARKEP